MQKATKLPPESEASFQKKVIHLAQLNGWRVAHFRPAMTAKGRWVTAVAGDGKGFPDLVLVRGGTILFAELKTDKGKLSEEQASWMGALLRATKVNESVRWYLWRPSHWDVIVELLSRE